MSAQVVRFTHHARVRCAQRAIREAHIPLIVNFGRSLHTAGATFHFFGVQEAKLHADLGRQVIEAITGAVVVLDRDGQVVLTTYRNHDALRRIRKKSRWGR